jgi:hypothetical protein
MLSRYAECLGAINAPVTASYYLWRFVKKAVLSKNNLFFFSNQI